ncbi:MAG: putative DNA-binding mobile mystery protein A [Alteromonadaceae bacterium]|jgi:predicted DNA-binding mobile mystery protein A
MNIKSLVVKQYRDIINAATQKITGIKVPPEGWLRTNRKAFQMPAKLIMEKAGIKTSELYRIEKAELDGTLTINKLKETANAMNCDFYYAVVPRGDISSIIEDKARRHAVKILNSARVQMELEDQATSMEQVELQVDKVSEQLIKEMPDWFWGETNDH